jgi:predicted phosphodiesterase
MGTTSPKGKIVLEFLDNHTESYIPSLTAAKMIFKETPLMFKNIEEVRSLIRYYRGSIGNIAKKKLEITDHITDKYLPPHKLNIPNPLGEDYTHFILPKQCTKIGVFSDFHFPNHRIEPIEIAIKKFHEIEANTIFLNGDVLDNTPFTRHGGKKPTPSDVREWFDMVEYFFEFLRDEFPTASIYWAEGNHDYWYKRWMMEHAWQLEEDPYFSLQERLHIDDYGINFIPDVRLVKAGKLTIHHGHRLMGMWGSGVSPARTVFLKAKKSVMIGHVHIADDYTDTNVDREITTCWSTGCMCTLTPDYMPIGGKACHGFATVMVKPNGNYNVSNYRIEGGDIL